MERRDEPYRANTARIRKGGALGGKSRWNGRMNASPRVPHDGSSPAEPDSVPDPGPSPSPGTGSGPDPRSRENKADPSQRARPTRIVSLLPSATEMVCAVGAADDLVGVSHECDFPTSVVGKPVLTSSRVSVTGTSGEIDRDVRELLRTVLTVYDVDVETLRAVDPQVIVTQDLCDVCAVSLSDVEAALKSIARSDVQIVSLKPGRLDDVIEDVRRVGVALGRAAEADEAIADLRARLAALRARANAIDAKPNVLTIEWIDPVMVGGTWMPELVEIAGGHALVTQPGDHAPTLDRAALAALDPAPDVVLVKPCGFKLERTEAELGDLHAILDGLPWPALETGAVFLADGNAYFNRPGPRLVESAEILAACIHPTEFGDLAAKHAMSFHAW